MTDCDRPCAEQTAHYRRLLSACGMFLELVASDDPDSWTRAEADDLATWIVGELGCPAADPMPPVPRPPGPQLRLISPQRDAPAPPDCA